MNSRLRFWVTSVCLAMILAGCAGDRQLSATLQRLRDLRLPQAGVSKAPQAEVVEQPVTVIPIDGELAIPRAELSGLAWYGDSLIFLPQFPHRFGNQLFFLPKAEIVRFLRQENPDPLLPQPLALINGDSVTNLAGFNGFEALAFQDNRAFLTIEAHTNDPLISYLVAGEMAPDLSALTLDLRSIGSIPTQTQINNLGDETILLADGQVLTFYEVNGFIINDEPVAHRFAQRDLQPLGTLPFPTIEYRITDATPLDSDQRFWAINYFFSGDRRIRNLELGPDPLAVQYGIGPTHRVSEAVERLVEFQYTPEGIIRLDQPPIQLQLLDSVARNWEGIVRLEEGELSGFLLVTDRFPETLLAFVPRPK